MTKRKHTTTQEKLKMPTKHRPIIKSQNTPNQGTPKKWTSKKTPDNQKSPKENANNHDNIKVTEQLSRLASLEKTVDVRKSELTIATNVNTKLSLELDDLEQYQRRACILVDGINLREEEN